MVKQRLMLKEKDAYAAGMLECKGGFYLHKGNNRIKKYIGFKIVSKENKKSISKLLICLKERKIIFKQYTNSLDTTTIYYINEDKMVRKLIKFISRYCYRDDYKKYKYDWKLGWFKS